MTTPIKATRATLEVGDRKLDVFQLLDSSYRYSKTDAESSLGYEPTRRAYRDFLKSKDSKAVRAKELSGGNITLKYMSKTYTLITQEEMTLFWGFQAQNGNTTALALIMACVQEALERRADTAFGVKRTEEERNLRFSLIMNSRVTRRSYTDILKDKLIEQYGLEGYKELAKNGYFKDITRRVNLHLFNTPHFKCDRENMTNDQLRDIELFEKQLERRANRFPDQTAEQLFQWMIDQF